MKPPVVKPTKPPVVKPAPGAAPEPTPVWITKYALTRGVYTARGVVEENMVQVAQEGTPRYVYFHRPDWHLTREEAEARVAQVKAAEIKALHKKIALLEKLPALPEAGEWPQASAKEAAVVGDEYLEGILKRGALGSAG